MSSTASSRTSASALALLFLAGCASSPPAKPLFRDDFTHGLAQWHIEAEKPGHITATGGVLDIDVPAGVTLWFRPKLEGPLSIDVATTVAGATCSAMVSAIRRT
jgi:hypothetical protein